MKPRTPRSDSPEPGAPWTVRLLGDPALIAPAGSVHPLERRAAALFALVALESGISRQRLATLLWPDSEESAARQALRQQLQRLKKLAGCELLVGTNALLLGPNVTTDLDRGESAGILLGTFDYAESEGLAQWVDRQRARRRDAELADLGQLLAEAEAQGDLDAALRLAEQLVATNDADERNHRSLIRLHYLRGDAARAEAAYDKLRELLRHEFGASPSPETEELVRAVRSARVNPSAPVVGRVPPPALLRPPRLIGRERELAAIAHAWSAQRAFLLVGEAGLGKSRLLAEVAADYPGCVLAQARPGDSGMPYASLARLLRAVLGRQPALIESVPRNALARVLPEVGQGLAVLPEGQRLWLQGAVESLLRTAHAAGVLGVLFDDLHFADAASLEMLQALLMSEAELPLRWGFAQRPAEDAGSAQTVQAALEDTGCGDVVILGPLDRNALTALIESLGIPALDAERLAPQLARHTGGNPMFALETLKSVVASGAGGGMLPRPGSVTALIDRRLRQLAPAALSLARVAAIAGVDFSIELAEQVLEVRALALADAWRELEAAQVLRGGGFAHDLVFETTLASIPEPIARHTHAAVARYLEEHTGEAARVARHWIAAGQGTRALKALHAAAEAARLAMRPREQAQFLEQAAAIERDSGLGEIAFRSLRDAAAARFMADRTELDDATLDRLLQAAHAPKDQAAALRLRSEVLIARGEYDKAVTTAERALALTGDDEALRCELLQVQGGALTMRGDFHGAVSALQRAAPWIENQGTRGQQLAFHGDLAVVLDNIDRHEDAQRHHERAARLALEQGDHANAVIVLSNLAVSYSNVGRLELATDALMRGERLAAAHDEARGAAAAIPGMLARCLRDLAQFNEALRWAEIGLRELTAQAPAWVPAMHVHVANTYLQLGQHARAWQELAQAGAPDELPGWQRSALLLAQARLRRALGQPAIEPITAALAAAPTEGRRPLRAAIELEHALTLEPAAALAAARRVFAEAEAHALHGVRLSALIRGCAFAVGAGEMGSATGYARAALDLAEDVHPDELYRGELWLQAGRAFERAGDRTRAGELYRAGAAWVREVSQQHVPAEFRESFLNRNAINRELLDAETRFRRLAT